MYSLFKKPLNRSCLLQNLFLWVFLQLPNKKPVRPWNFGGSTIRLAFLNSVYFMYLLFGLSHLVCSGSAGGTWRRFMSQGEYLSVTDQPVLRRWQVSPSPQWCLSSLPLINSLWLAKWGLETHLLPTRDPLTNGDRCKDLYLKLCGGCAERSDWVWVLYFLLWPQSAQKPRTPRISLRYLRPFWCVLQEKLNRFVYHFSLSSICHHIFL